MVPKDLISKTVTSFHRLVFDLSKGKVAGKASGMPVLKLTTIGRKSGQPRPTMLTSPLVEGDNVILVASNGGDDRNPMWFSNILANPDVEVVMDGSTKADAGTGGRERRAHPVVGGADRQARQLRRLSTQDLATDSRRGARTSPVATEISRPGCSAR